MATRIETRPMSPFARARASAGSDLTTDLRATISKVDELIKIEQSHNNELRELILGLETRLQADLSAVRSTVTVLEGRVTAIEKQNKTILQAISSLNANLTSFRSDFNAFRDEYNAHAHDIMLGHCDWRHSTPPKPY